MLEILLVDDEPSIRLSVSDRVRGAGHGVRTACDGAEAETLIAVHPFDVVVTDVRLPKQDGLTILRNIRREHPGTEVILITAFGLAADAVSALKDGAADFLTKPFEIDQLLHVLDRIDKQRSMKRELEQARSELAAITGRTSPGAFRPLADALRDFEKEYLGRALEATQGKKGEAAGLLGISRKNLWEKLKAYEMGASRIGCTARHDGERTEDMA